MILNKFKISRSCVWGGGGVKTPRVWTCVHCQASRKCLEMLPCYCHYDKH